MIALAIPRRDLTEIRPEDRRVAPVGLKRGVIISTPYEGGRSVEMDACQCCHCQMVFPYVRNSGKDRGWCSMCRDLTCGRPECDPCVPVLQMLENMRGDSGIPWHLAKKHLPIVGRVEAAPPKAATRTRGATAGGILLPG